MVEPSFKIVYFGNKISKYKKSNAALETLEPLFAEFSKIKTFSSLQNKYLRLLEMIFQFFKNGLRSDLILIDMFSTSGFYFAYILCRLSVAFRKPYVLILRGGNLPYRFEKSKRMMDLVFKKSAHIVAPSHYLKSFFEKEGYNITYIPNIIELGRYNFKIRKSIQPRILNIRGFGKPYNPKMTVRAVKLLVQRFPDLKLVMLGDDANGMISEIKKLIKELDIEKNVDILDKMTRDEWVNFAKSFDIMVSNPVIDNTPVSVIEGMALGLLIISTDVGGISYLLSNRIDALLVPSDDHVKLAEAITMLIDNPDLCSRMQENAHKKAETFSWYQIKPMWKDLLLNSSKPNVDKMK